MEVIMLHHPHKLDKEKLPKLAMALGFFDGVHKGHQQVIQTAVQIAKKENLKSAVMTFDPHPSVVLGSKHKHIEHITPLEEKKRVIASLGIDYLFIVRFTSDFAALEPQQFIDDYIIKLHVKHVIAGFDYTYGKLGKGTMDTIQFHSRGQFLSSTIEKHENGSEKISSTRIRALLKEGQMEKAEELLGRPYKVDGTVIHGDKRGRKIGFPTANIQLSDDYFIPKMGVYAVKMNVKGNWHNGVCNIGFRPTFKNPNEPSLSIEVHIFNFSNSIYGEEVAIEWYLHIRGEQKFDGIDSLKAQIEKDKQAAIAFFHSSRPNE